MDLTLFMYLIPSLIMFGCGVYGFITRKNMIAIMISLELMLNSVDINFVVFNRINVFRIARNVDINQITKLKF